MFLLCLSSCFQTSEMGMVKHLERKLESAEKVQKRAETEVAQLKDEIVKAQLSMIRKQIDEYEKWVGKDPQKVPELVQHGISGLFIQEREALHRVIQSAPDVFADEAQAQLDRILRMITALSDGDFMKR